MCKAVRPCERLYKLIFSRKDSRQVSKFTAIRAVSKTLQTLLDTGMKAEPEFSSSSIPISLLSPKAIREQTSAVTGITVSVWLYRVTRNEHILNNRPDRNVPGPDLQH